MTNYTFININRYDVNDSLIHKVEDQSKELAARQVLTEVYGYMDDEIDDELSWWKKTDNIFGVDHEENSFLVISG